MDRKKITLFFGLITSLFLISSNSYSRLDRGGMGSGGGKGMVCFDSPEIADEVRDNEGIIPTEYINNITSVEMLDLYYAKLAKGSDASMANLVKEKEGENYLDYFVRILNRIERTIPFLGKEIVKSQEKFNNGQILFLTKPLTPMFDENDVGFNASESCSKTTMAVQYFKQGKYFLHIDMRLFFHRLHSERSKAVLLLHEYLYLISRNKGETSSRRTRELIGHLIKNEEDTKLHQIIENVYFLGFLGDENDYTFDPPLYSAPITSMYEIARKYILESVKFINQFDQIRPEHVLESEEIIKRTIDILNDANMNAKQPQTISQVIYELTCFKDKVLDVNFSARANDILAEAYAYMDEMSKGLKSISDDQAIERWAYKNYISKLNYLNKQQKQKLMQVAQAAGNIALEMAQGLSLPENYFSHVLSPDGRPYLKKFVFPHIYFLEDLPKSFSEISLIPGKNERWLIRLIYKKNQDLGGIVYNQLLFPAI